MPCSPYLVYTGVTDTGLCSGGGSPTTIYIDSAVVPFSAGTFVYSDSSCSSAVTDSFFFYYLDYVYDYSGSDLSIKFPTLCPTPTPTPTPTNTPTPTPTTTNTPTPTPTTTNTPTPTTTNTPTPTPSTSFIVSDTYCIINTDTYNGTYSLAPTTYDGYNYYTGATGFIYYSLIESRWCLSDNLGDPCVQFGTYGSTSINPDFDDTVAYEGICVTTTTTTNPCVDFDFSAIFDCLVTPSPSLTPTNTPTPTPTPTPTSSAICGGLSMSVTASGYTPTPTPTNTPTPSPSPDVTRPCSFSGDVTFSTISEILQCANSKRFTNCFTGIHYYTSDLVLVSGETSPNQGYIYNAVINGQGMCVLFDGLFENISGVDSVTLTNEVGSQIDGACLQCIPNLSQTPTPTPTNTPTPTPSVSPCVLYEYRVTNNSPSNVRFNYTSCSGSESGTVPSYSSVIVCSTITPTSSSSNVVVAFLNTVCV